MAPLATATVPPPMLAEPFISRPSSDATADSKLASVVLVVMSIRPIWYRMNWSPDSAASCASTMFRSLRLS